MQKRHFYIFTLFLYTISSCIIYQKFNHYFSPDAISYLSITEHILKGEFYESINGYWSPLISWILVPIHFFIKDGILSFQIVNFLFGIFILYILNKIVLFYKFEKLLTYLIIGSCSILIASVVLLHLTADILFLAMLLSYYYICLNKSRYSFWIFSLLGFLLYLSKAYGFYFILALEIIQVVYYILSNKKLKLLFTLKTIAAFLVFSLLWITAISIKNNSFLISSASSYNKNIISENGQIVHPCDTMRLIMPIPEHIYTAWEEMSLYTKKEIEKKQETNWFNLNLVEKNINTTFKLLNKTSRYGLLIFCILILLNLYFQKSFFYKLALPVALGFIFIAGYLLYFVEERYILFPIFLLIICNSILATQLIRLNHKFNYALYIILTYSILRPAVDYYLYTNQSDEQASYYIANNLSNNINKTYATYNAYQLPNIAYFNKWKNYGGISGYKKDSLHLEQDLSKYSINYLILPDTIQLPQNVIPLYNKLSLSNLNRYTVYMRN